MKKKQVNLNERKTLLKEFLSKLISNKVTYINGKIIRASDLTYSLCQEVEKQVFDDVTIKISPYSHDYKNVKNSIFNMTEINTKTVNVNIIGIDF